MKFYISETQSIASILNQLTHTEENDIEFIFPEQSIFFSDIENVELLKNQAKLLGKAIAILSANEQYVDIARRIGIPAQVKSAKKEKTQSETLEKEETFEEIEEDFLTKESPKEGEFTKRYFDLGKPVELPTQETPILIRKEPGKRAHEDPQESEEPAQGQNTQPPSFFDEGNESSGLKEREVKRQPIEEELQAVSILTSRTTMVKAAVGVALVAILGFLYVYLPKATVEVFAQRERIAFSFDVVGKKNTVSVDADKRIVPVQSLEITKELTQPFSVKQKGSSMQKAKGHITVYNDYTKPQGMIPSRFAAQNGNIYWSQRNISIPARKSLEIEVVADKPGTTYNLDCSLKAPCSFTVPAWKGTENFTKIYGKAASPLTGGSSGEGYIVSVDEYQQAQNALRAELISQAQKELALRIPNQYKLLEDSIHSELISIASEPAVGAVSADGKAMAKGTILMQAFALKEADIHDLVNVLVKNQLDNSKEARPDSIKIDYKVNSSDAKQGSISINVNASEEVAFVIDAQDLKEKMKGKSEEEVRKFLGDLPKVQSAQVTLWPFWVRTIPTNTQKIHIDIK